MPASPSQAKPSQASKSKPRALEVAPRPQRSEQDADELIEHRLFVTEVAKYFLTIKMCYTQRCDTTFVKDFYLIYSRYLFHLLESDDVHNTKTHF